ncbi:hypothetical protein E4191_05695 [Paracoccus liaowanqingii]|uniref:Uncharacterized protein n=1 Tax=Paracoccus liaowanqingii TaxID=2560053 RepID=A0A4P7HJG7_9RHOB|nr:hypothetical protein [Paracoccus liaowanqingii]QBX34264.1 hypothetical protein E4191_05695 [Paracoccus liaowanqingii]
MIVVASGALDGGIRSPTPDENLFMALALITFAGGTMFVFWALSSESKVAQGFCRMVDKVNDLLTFGRNR